MFDLIFYKKNKYKLAHGSNQLAGISIDGQEYLFIEEALYVLRLFVFVLCVENLKILTQCFFFFFLKDSYVNREDLCYSIVDYHYQYNKSMQ
jgi:hypothetical protein